MLICIYFFNYYNFFLPVHHHIECIQLHIVVAVGGSFSIFGIGRFVTYFTSMFLGTLRMLKQIYQIIVMLF